MKTVQNKTMVPQSNKAITNPVFQKVMETAAEIRQANPDTREGLLRGLSQAQAARKQAEEDKANAQSEAELDKALDDAVRAREKETFFRRLLNKYDFTPRMNGEEYSAAVESVEAVVEKAAEAYRETAQKAIDLLVNARREYEKTMKDADIALETLDNAANVLQSRHRYRVTTYTGGGETRTEDRGEWRNHTVRFMGGKGYDLIARNPGDDTAPAGWNYAMTAAWNLPEKI